MSYMVAGSHHVWDHTKETFQNFCPWLTSTHPFTAIKPSHENSSSESVSPRLSSNMRGTLEVPTMEDQ